jgi:hypothetical protein
MVMDRTVAGTGAGALSGAAAGGVVAGPWGAAGGAILGGIFGYLNSQAADEADEASKQRLKEIAEKIQREWQTPNLDSTPLTPEEYKVLSRYVPQTAQLIQEKTPQMISEAGSQREIGAQQEALSRYQELAKSGTDAQQDAATQKALYTASENSKANRAAIARQYEQRGLGGSGMDFLGEVADQGQQNQNAYLASLDAVANAQKTRMAALGQYADLAGSTRGQNLNVERSNNDTINQFNERATRTKNQYNQYLAETANKAQLENQGREQIAADNNVSRANQFMISNRDTKNSNEMSRVSNFNNRLGAELGIAQQGNTLEGQIAANRVGAQKDLFNAGIGAATTYGAYNSAKERADKEDKRYDQQYELQKDRNDIERARIPVAPVVGDSQVATNLDAEGNIKPKYNLGTNTQNFFNTTNSAG